MLHFMTFNRDHDWGRTLPFCCAVRSLQISPSASKLGNWGGGFAHPVACLIESIHGHAYQHAAGLWVVPAEHLHSCWHVPIPLWHYINTTCPSFSSKLSSATESLKDLPISFKPSAFNGLCSSLSLRFCMASAWTPGFMSGPISLLKSTTRSSCCKVIARSWGRKATHVAMWHKRGTSVAQTWHRRGS